MNQAGQVVGEGFAENLVHLSIVHLGSNRTTQLSLHSTECALNIRPLMIVLQELILLVVEEMLELPPLLRSITCRVDLERNVRDSSNRRNHVEVIIAQVGFVGGHVDHIEVFRRCLYQSR